VALLGIFIIICFVFSDLSDVAAIDNFSIHPVNGWILTEEVLDYETLTTYRLVVIATDAGTPRRSNRQTITINVDDDNDEAPLFHAREVRNCYNLLL
jgi:hypothetical protein